MNNGDAPYWHSHLFIYRHRRQHQAGAGTSRNQGQFRLFIQLFGAIDGTKYYYSFFYYVPPVVQSTFQQHILTAHEKLDQQDLEAAEAEGKAMIFEQVLSLVVEILA